jgi:thymidylate synthase ThyX
VTVYVPEEYTADEADVLRRYFTNLDQPVFALVNLPEVVKGALFARYSRSPKSLRRLFLDEFVGDLDVRGDASVDATIGLQRAEQLYEKVFVEYGDDSVAQLGGVHLACEQASNLLTKVLEWGRLMSYLEQSTRYIAYDARLGGRYRYYRDPQILTSRFGTRYVGDMDRLFDSYSMLLGRVTDHVRATVPQHPGTATSSTGRPRGPRRSTPCAGCCRPPHCRTWASTAPGRPTRLFCCACGPTRSPRPRPTPS